MLNSINILNVRGDSILNFNQSGNMMEKEIFTNQVKTNHALEPLFTHGQLKYQFEFKQALYFLIITSIDFDERTLPTLLKNILSSIEIYLGSVSEDVIRRNMVFIYELLNELVDQGQPQLQTINQLSHIINPPREEDEGILNIKIGNSHKTNSSASKRSISKGKLEFQIDVIERIRTTIKNDEVLFADVYGGVVNKNQFNKEPLIGKTTDASIRFDNKINIVDELTSGEREIHQDECLFAPQVIYKNFKSNRSLDFSSENGEKLIMTQKTQVKKVQLPILIGVQVASQTQYSFKISIEVNQNFNNKFHCNQLSMMFKVRKNAHVKFLAEENRSEIEFQPNNDQYVTSIGKRQGDSKEILNQIVSLNEAIDIELFKREINSIDFNFEIASWNVSGMTLQKIELTEKSVTKFARQTCLASNYQYKL